LRNREIDGLEFKRMWEQVDEVVAMQMGEVGADEEVAIGKGKKRQETDEGFEEADEQDASRTRKRTKTTAYVVLSDEGEDELVDDSGLDESAAVREVGTRGRGGITRGRGRGRKRLVGPFRVVSGKVSIIYRDLPFVSLTESFALFYKV
jgi:hypothetical protein